MKKEYNKSYPFPSLKKIFMPVFKILQYPDIRLRRIAKPVKEVNKNIKKIIDRMFETMYQNNGIGLAATQINIHLQIAVAVDSEKTNNHIVLINPNILSHHGSITTEEGCLSLQGKRAKISRPSHIKVHTINWSNKIVILKANSLLSVCLQHEIDHLSGKLFIDYLQNNKKIINI